LKKLNNNFLERANTQVLILEYYSNKKVCQKSTNLIKIYLALIKSKK